MVGTSVTGNLYITNCSANVRFTANNNNSLTGELGLTADAGGIGGSGINSATTVHVVTVFRIDL